MTDKEFRTMLTLLVKSCEKLHWYILPHRVYKHGPLSGKKKITSILDNCIKFIKDSSAQFAGSHKIRQ